MKKLFLILFVFAAMSVNAQWQKMFQIYATIYEFTGNPNYVFCATGPTGVFRSIDSGLTWDTVNSGLANKNVKAITAQGIYIFAATDSGLFRSTNNGNNWSSIPNYKKYVHHLACNDQFIFAGTILGIYRSSDHGITWDSINNGLPRQLYGLPAYISAISTSTNYIYTAISSWGMPQIYKTSNYGNNWYPITNSGTDSTEVYSLESKDSIILCGTGSGVYISRNSGINWRKIPEVNPNIGLFGLSIIDDKSIFIASYGYGVHVSTNGGFNWVFKNEGINSGEYNSCALFSRGDYTFLGTRPFEYYLPAVFRRNTSQLIPVIDDNTIVPKDTKLFQNYPNPFNPKTTIKFKIPYSSLVKISIYNTTGKEIDMLINKELKAGTYETIWNSANYPSGVYYCRLVTSQQQIANKMILLK